MRKSHRCQKIERGPLSFVGIVTLNCRGAPDRKISVRPGNRTGLIEAGDRPNRTLSLIVSDEGLFSELGNEDYEKLFPRHNFMNFDSGTNSIFRCTYTFSKLDIPTI